MQRKPWQNVTPILDLKKEKSIIKLGIRGNVFTHSSVRNICQKMQGSLIPNVDMSEDFLLRKLIFNISKQHCNGGSTFLIRKTLKRRKLFSFIKYTIICLKKRTRITFKTIRINWHQFTKMLRWTLKVSEEISN